MSQHIEKPTVLGQTSITEPIGNVKDRRYLEDPSDEQPDGGLRGWRIGQYLTKLYLSTVNNDVQY
jgi:hypothetical protein